MNCDLVQQQLQEFVDGQLSPDENESVKAHLADCQLADEI